VPEVQFVRPVEAASGFDVRQLRGTVRADLARPFLYDGTTHAISYGVRDQRLRIATVATIAALAARRAFSNTMTDA